MLSISGYVTVNDSRIETITRTVADTEMTVHNIYPTFNTEEAWKEREREIARSLYEVFSKYD